MTALSGIAGENEDYSDKAKALKEKINSLYWNKEKGAFTDSFVSGKNFVSRQTNVFAVLFDFADEEQKNSIINNVFKNPSLPAITTPYFKLYELMAMCKVGMLENAQNYISSYWGGMLKLGATSVWEFYDESQTGTQHLQMYGNKYGKSLCHAWGSGPILLLLRYCAGVYPTEPGYGKFNVEPKCGIYTSFKAAVPVGNGLVTVELKDGKYTVLSSVSGGTLIVGGKKISLEKDKSVTV